MRSALFFAFLLLVCPLAQWLGLIAPAGTPAPAPSVPAPHVEISASAVRMQVGDTFSLTGVAVNLGLPYFTLSLSSGAQTTITYSGEIRTEVGDGYLARDDLFEIVSAQADLNSVTFQLRALAPGTADAVISATGEVQTPEGAFMWGSGQSDAQTLTIEG